MLSKDVQVAKQRTPMSGNVIKGKIGKQTSKITVFIKRKYNVTLPLVASGKATRVREGEKSYSEIWRLDRFDDITKNGPNSVSSQFSRKRVNLSFLMVFLFNPVYYEHLDCSRARMYSVVPREVEAVSKGLI